MLGLKSVLAKAATAATVPTPLIYALIWGWDFSEIVVDNPGVSFSIR